MNRGAPTVLVNAASARVGGGLAFAEELLPRLATALADRGFGMRVQPSGGLLRSQIGALRGPRSGAVFNVANTSLLGARLPQLVAVRDRILVEPADALPEAKTARTAARRAALDVALRQCAVWAIPSEAMRGPLVEFASGRRISVPLVEVVAHGAPAGWQPQPMPTLPPLRILHPSHGAPQKNIPLLIRAVGRLPAELRPTLTLTFDSDIGGGTLAEDARRWAPGRVVFRGPVPRRELAALYAEHHLLAFPSSVESLGIPLLEALAAGRPIVVSDLDWAREACGPYAVYAPPGDVDAWVDALQEVAQSGGLTTARPVPHAWLARFSWDTASQRYAELLSALTDHSGC